MIARVEYRKWIRQRVGRKSRAARTAILVFGAALLATSTSKSAPRLQISDPKAFVRDVYRNLKRDETQEVNRPIYSPPEYMYTHRLGALYSKYLKRMNGDLGCLDFSYWLNAQDSTLSDIDITSRRVPGNASREIVIARFKNAGTPEEIEFEFQRGAGEWLLDEVRSLKDPRWVLSDLLRCKQ
jgi:hypothetical protein